MYYVDTAYFLWALGFCGLCGLHRFYLGKPVSGLIWLFTFGGLGVLQLVDGLLIPSMVSELNWRFDSRRYSRSPNVNVNVNIDNRRWN